MSRYHHRSRHTYIDWVIPVVTALILAISVYFQIQGAVQCAADGGEYVRNWANWPVCIGAK